MSTIVQARPRRRSTSSLNLPTASPIYRRPVVILTPRFEVGTDLSECVLSTCNEAVLLLTHRFKQGPLFAIVYRLQNRRYADFSLKSAADSPRGRDPSVWGS